MKQSSYPQPNMVYDQAKKELKQLAPTHVEESVLVVCPFCKQDWEDQGRPSEWSPRKSCKITRVPAGLLYVCYRASCDKHGLLFSTVTCLEHLVPKSTQAFEPKYPNTDLQGLPQVLKESLADKYDLPISVIDTQGFVWSERDGRLYQPIFNAFAKQIGWDAKEFAVPAQPKSLMFKFEPDPILHFPLYQDMSDTVVIVEDILSANKVALAGYFCAALCGSSLSQATVLTLKSIGVRNVIMMLDADAVGKAVKAMKEYYPFFSQFSFIPLEGPDPKYKTLSKIRDLVQPHIDMMRIAHEKVSVF